MSGLTSQSFPADMWKSSKEDVLESQALPAVVPAGHELITVCVWIGFSSRKRPDFSRFEESETSSVLSFPGEPPPFCLLQYCNLFFICRYNVDTRSSNFSKHVSWFWVCPVEWDRSDLDLGVLIEIKFSYYISTLILLVHGPNIFKCQLFSLNVLFPLV